MRAGIYHNSTSPIVFYDGDCPLCSKEINHYRKLRGSESLLWIDLNNDGGVMMRHGLDKPSALARFHVLDAKGQWQTGAYGFTEMWSHIPSWRWLSTMTRTLRLLPLMDWTYTYFAKWRLQRECDTGQCAPSRK